MAIAIYGSSEVWCVEQWYNRRSRDWVVQCFDVDGNQVGDSDYSGTRVDSNTDLATALKKAKLNPQENKRRVAELKRNRGF